MRSVAGVEREVENVRRIARRQRLRRFSQPASADVLHHREVRGLAESVRQVKLRHAAGMGEIAKRQRSIQMTFDGPQSLVGQHGDAAWYFPVSTLARSLWSLRVARLIQIAVNRNSRKPRLERNRFTLNRLAL